MRILFVADGRSPIAQNWMRYWRDRGDEVFLATTFALPSEPGASQGATFQDVKYISVAFSEAKPAAGASSRPRSGIWGARTLGLRTAIRQWLGPLTISRAALRLREYIQQVQPQIVHALRIPYEGMLAAEALAPLRVPLALSVWGNDFTLHAPATPLMRHYTTLALQVADALHADCQRDIRLAKTWGFNPAKPTLVTPGNGGIQTDLFCPPAVPAFDSLVLNPRGFRSYVRNDTFFRAIPIVLQGRPDAHFACASMAGDPQAEGMIRDLGIGDSVELLPNRPHHQMAEVFQSAQVVVSPAIHDGTPNTLLEAMACGCFPVAGDLESIREWITPEHNGLLVNPADPAALAIAILRGLSDPALRQRAAEHNAALIAERGEYTANMQKAADWYTTILGKAAAS